MELLSPKISFSFKEDGLKIRMHEDESNSTFLEVTLTAEQTCKAFSGLMNTPCSAEVHNLHRLGKKMIHKKFEFPIVDDSYNGRIQNAIEMVKEVCPKGWTPDLYFNSQSSFFHVDGMPFARTTIRKYVCPDNEEV